MRVIAYVREAPGFDQGESAFVQSERIRKWVAQHRCKLIAVCQDSHVPGSTGTLEGYRALLGIVATGNVDTLVIPTLGTLSADLITQEVMLWDLRSRGINVVSAEEADLEALAVPTRDASRMFIRDVLEKRHDYRRSLEGSEEPQIRRSPERDVLIELIPASPAPPVAQAS